MIEEKIFEILDTIPEEYSKFNYTQKKVVLDSVELQWKKLPTKEKHECSESAMIALWMLDEYLLNKETEKARPWGELLINDKERGDYGEKEMIRGKLYYSNDNFDLAMEQFIIAMQKSEGRMFEGQDKKYIDLLKKK